MSAEDNEPQAANNSGPLPGQNLLADIEYMDESTATRVQAMISHWRQMASQEFEKSAHNL